MSVKKIIQQIVILLVLAILPAAGTGLFHPKRPGWDREALADGEVTLQTALAWGDKVLWIDARSGNDFQKAHIPGAMPLNEDDWDALLPEVLNAWNPDRIIVVYCSSLQCEASKEVAQRLRDKVQLPQVFVLKGGWESWLARKK